MGHSFFFIKRCQKDPAQSEANQQQSKNTKLDTRAETKLKLMKIIKGVMLELRNYS